MYVYFVRAWGDCPLIKIGKAKDPEDRIKKLQTGCPLKLNLIGVVRCKSDLHAKQVERMAHRMFWKQRRIGEWFRLSAAGERAIHQVIAIANADADATDRADEGNRVLDKEWAERVSVT